jgi:hypothetical protein
LARNSAAAASMMRSRFAAAFSRLTLIVLGSLALWIPARFDARQSRSWKSRFWQSRRAQRSHVPCGPQRLTIYMTVVINRQQR